MVDSGILLVKYWLEVSQEEQTRRLQSRIDDPRKGWKLSPMDLKSYGRWYDYSRARDDMFHATHSPWAPWFVANTDDKKRGRLNIISHLLSQVPYEPLPSSHVTLPKRRHVRGYVRAGARGHPHPRALLTHGDDSRATRRAPRQRAQVRPRLGRVPRLRATLAAARRRRGPCPVSASRPAGHGLRRARRAPAGHRPLHLDPLPARLRRLRALAQSSCSDRTPRSGR